MAGVVALVEEYTVSVSHTGIRSAWGHDPRNLREPSVMTLAQMIEGLREAHTQKARIYSIALTGMEVVPILAQYDFLKAEIDRLEQRLKDLYEGGRAEIERLMQHCAALETALKTKTDEFYPDLRAEIGQLRALVNDCPVCSQLHKFYGLKP